MLCVALAVGVRAESSLRLTNPEIDFGVTLPNSVLRGATWVVNGSPDSLKIASVRTGCTCISLLQIDSTIAPNDSVLVEFFWNLPSTYSELEKTVYIFIEGHNQPLNVRAMVLTTPPVDWPGNLSISPKSLGFDPREGFLDTLELTLKNPSELPVLVRSAGIPGGIVDFSVPDTVEPESTQMVQLYISWTDTERRLGESVTIEYITPDMSPLRATIPVAIRGFSFRPK